MIYTARTFDLPELKGLSKKQIDVHLALYEGYVKHVNLILETIQRLRSENAEQNAFIIAELRRRLGFEFDGMRMHEYYFDQFVGGNQAAEREGNLFAAATEKYGGWDEFVTHLKEVAGTRGIGWVVVYFDAVAGTLHTAFVNDHEIGQLSGLPIILAIDLWEHAFMVDYVPAEKKTYVEAFLENMNWSVAESRLNTAQL
ncbi:Fe-Mn family superoxide dismutase [Patescibacteria group bacterium]|nr:Fe-Mn family superoxide dismutase [Patescibacteria group bacterium]MBU2159031.1 Fe-Mn family superoxide dismutase [Patescibacteria group bacterium]MBU2220543.1 Fe-Mn family superoxide dismutase [Patescibacteria group bacterium]